MNIVVEEISFKSGEAKIVGRLYRPEEIGGKVPSVVLCHGFPGDTKNIDLAEDLAFNGYVALVFYYQGAWGSSGKYTLTKLEENTKDAIEYVLSKPYVDQNRLALIGHSMGSVPVSKTISNNRTVKTAVFLSPGTNFNKLVLLKGRKKHLAFLLRIGKGKLTGLNRKDLLEDLKWVNLNSNPLNTIKKATIPVLVVVGSKDDITSPRSCKLLYQVANEPKEYREIFGADHFFLRHRVIMIDNVISWLKGHL